MFCEGVTFDQEDVAGDWEMSLENGLVNVGRLASMLKEGWGQSMSDGCRSEGQGFRRDSRALGAVHLEVPRIPVLRVLKLMETYLVRMLRTQDSNR